MPGFPEVKHKERNISGLFSQPLDDLPDGVRRADKGGGNIIKAHLHPKTDIILVFFCQGRKLDLYIRNIYTLFLT